MVRSEPTSEPGLGRPSVGSQSTSWALSWAWMVFWAHKISPSSFHNESISLTFNVSLSNQAKMTVFILYHAYLGHLPSLIP